MAKTEEAPVRREFTNEFGNRIVITVTREVPDTDLVCTECRWRAGHAPGCTRAKEPWPSVTLDEERTLIRIEGPSSVSENFLTPMEVRMLRAACDEYLRRWKVDKHKRCPFCGETPYDEPDVDDDGFYFVVCMCGASGPSARLASEASRDWNERVFYAD